MRNNVNPINPIEMIVTHPWLFNAIVVLFIAFTSGWIVYVIINRRTVHFKNKMKKLEHEKEHLRMHALQLEEQLQKPVNNTPVISLAASVKNNKTKDAGM